MIKLHNLSVLITSITYVKFEIKNHLDCKIFVSLVYFQFKVVFIISHKVFLIESYFQNKELIDGKYRNKTVIA